ncbi:metallophosphoesterase [Halobaculum sp. CBA1158]|uniref:metallophosphoesterase n=1 Tax=Halobaculum sp. CBA1158 TaxID=2904243 RepID=UPI001F2BFB7A|nr:metallophosphoesterase [Halobaculum sp. CBA1158]UIP00699.1 metallophosphoesterase [Halobaculum sp. CBA1158]
MLDAAFGDRAVYLRGADALVIADLHVGRATASDVAYPIDEAGDLAGRLRGLLDRFAPAEVAFAGDVLHRFDRVAVGDERALSRLVDACRDAGASVALVAGNHDTALSAVRDDPVTDAHALDAGRDDGPIVVRHGHESPPADEDAGVYVVGHDHPTIDVEGRRRPCFLYGERAHGGADVLMLPPFSRVAPGVEVNEMRARDFDSPFVADPDAFRPILATDGDADPLVFPPLGECRRLL